jgi:hypothetical protein
LCAKAGLRRTRLALAWWRWHVKVSASSPGKGSRCSLLCLRSPGEWAFDAIAESCALFAVSSSSVI